MSDIQDNIQLVDDKMDEAVNKFLEGVSKSQTGIFNQLLSIAKELETANGNIKPSQKNLRLLRELRVRIQNEVLNQTYRDRSLKFVDQYDSIAKLNNGYFNAITEAFNPNRQVYRQVLRSSKDATIESLLGAGINEQVVEPVVNIVSDSITNGATWEDMVDELRTYIKGGPETLGRLERYSKQITTDGINQFNANYNQSIANDLDLDWYLYSGGVRSTSRPFCRKYAGKWYHKKEVEDFGKGDDLDGGKLCTGDFCKGRVKGTNSSSIFRYRGGYNCRHIFKPATIDAVPKNVIKRNVDKGYIEAPDDISLKGIKPKEVKGYKPFDNIKDAEEYGRNNFISDESKEYILSSNKKAQEWLNRMRKTYPDLPEKNAGFKTDISYKGLSIESANKINARLDFYFNQKGLPKLATIKARRFAGKNKNIEAQMSNLGNFEINSTLLKDPKTYSNAHNKFENTINEFRKVIPTLENKRKQGLLTAKDEKLFKYASEMAKFDRMTVSNKIENIIDHEIGHHIDNTKYIIAKQKGLSESWVNEKISSGMKQANLNEYKYGISQYAFSDIFVQRQEVFAETFSMYMNDEDKKIPPDLLDVFKKLIPK